MKSEIPRFLDNIRKSYSCFCTGPEPGQQYCPCRLREEAERRDKPMFLIDQTLNQQIGPGHLKPGPIINTTDEEMTMTQEFGLKKYRSHKVVEAGLICFIQGRENAYQPCTAVLSDGVQVTLSAGYMDKHKPKVGGYYVRYPDGYESFSPAKAFEEGYTLVENLTPTLGSEIVDLSGLAKKPEIPKPLATMKGEHSPLFDGFLGGQFMAKALRENMYRGYSPVIEQTDNGQFHGRIKDIDGLVTFEADTWKDCYRAFKEAVDDYLVFCEEEGLLPEVPNA